LTFAFMRFWNPWPRNDRLTVSPPSKRAGHQYPLGPSAEDALDGCGGRELRNGSRRPSQFSFAALPRISGAPGRIEGLSSSQSCPALKPSVGVHLVGSRPAYADRRALRGGVACAVDGGRCRGELPGAA